MNFEETHAAFIRYHLTRRSGERKGRLERGHQHGEQLFLQQIWWPLKGDLDDLHPEYEVLDWRGRSYFGDFAYLPGNLKFLLEIKGYGSHVRDMDRKRFCVELNRETFLQSMGFRIVSFAYDDIAHRPDLCIALLHMLLSRYQPGKRMVDRTVFAENEVIRLAYFLARSIRPIDVANHFDINQRTAVRLLQTLCTKGWLRPVIRGKGVKVLHYELVHGVWDYND